MSPERTSKAVLEGAAHVAHVKAPRRTDNQLELSYADVPDEWALCFQDDCALRDSCLRFRMGLLMPDTVTLHNVVLPHARRTGACTLYADGQPVQLAWGMRGLFANVPEWKAKAIRAELYDLFGSRAQYFRYRNGRYPITPERQAQVAQLFSQHGISTPPRFDAVQAAICFQLP